jgi:hypothetical protein
MQGSCYYRGYVMHAYVQSLNVCKARGWGDGWGICVASNLVDCQ